MKRNFIFCFCFILILFSSSFAFAQATNSQAGEEKLEKSEEKMEYYSLEIADKISTFSLKGKIFFMFSNEQADIVEVTPIRSDICKIVISVPQDKVQKNEIYTVYLRKNDLVLFQRGSKTYGGYVKDFDYNTVRLYGRMTD